MDEIMVSVSCCAYNHEKYIRKCLDGFVRQKTNFKFEVIVHDDASTDNTAEIIREYEKLYPNIIKPIYQKENQYSQGISIKKQYMLPKLQGKYIATCEGDDWWIDDEKLQRQFDYMENHPECSICTHNAIFHDSRTGDERLNTPEIHERDFGIDEIITSGGDLFATNSVFIRREYYFNRPECFDCKGVGDYQQVVYAAMCGKCHYMSAVMSRYNYANNNSWTARVWADPEKRVVHFQQMINMLKNVDQYYQYQYTVPIQEKITALEYAGYKLTNNRSAMRRKKYRKYYNKEKIVRLKIWGKKVLQAVFEQEHRKR